MEERRIGRFKITMDLMEGECGDKTCVGTLLGVGKTNTCQDRDGVAIHIIFHCLSSYVGALMKIRLIISK